MKSIVAPSGYRTFLSMLCILMAVTVTASAQSAERYSFEFRDDPLDYALFRISQVTGAHIMYESRLTAGIRVTARYQEQQLGPILSHLLQPSALEARRIRTGMYILQYTLRSEMEPIMSVSVSGAFRKPNIRTEVWTRGEHPPGPLRDRPMPWE